MSEFTDILNDVVTDRAAGTTTKVLNTRNGLTFLAEIEGPLDPLIIQTELGQDLREVCKLHIQGNINESQINIADRIQFVLYGLKTTHTVVKRTKDSGDPFTDFWVQKQSSKDAN